jgi:hypothetical protein
MATIKEGDSTTLVHQEEASEMAIKMDLNHSNPKLKVQT